VRLPIPDPRNSCLAALPAGFAPPEALEVDGMPPQETTKAKPLDDGWLAGVGCHQVDYVLLNCRSDRRLLSAMHSRPGWKLELQDGDSVLYARTGKSEKGEET
jgi:hypothetical protein